MAALEFEPPDEQPVFCLTLARQTMKAGGTANGVLNAANEFAVAKFLGEKIAFADIAKANAHALQQLSLMAAGTVEELKSMDTVARPCADDFISSGLTSVGLN